MSYNYNKFSFNDNSVKIIHTQEQYDTTKSGSFKKAPATTTIETVDNMFYTRFVRSVSFFNGFMGGTCRASWKYTKHGRLPYKITTINPDRTMKQIDYFSFEEAAK